MRRHVIRMSDIADIHPPTDRLILMVVPVDHRPHGAYYKKYSDRQRQEKCHRHHRLSPTKLFHLMPAMIMGSYVLPASNKRRHRVDAEPPLYSPLTCHRRLPEHSELTRAPARQLTI